MLAENKITLASLYKILFEEEPLTLSDPCMQKLEESFHFLKTFSNDKIIYGINTGFGPMAQYRIEDESLSQLQYKIIFILAGEVHQKIHAAMPPEQGNPFRNSMSKLP